MASKKDKVKDRDRFSILVPSLDRCYLCGSSDRVALHEVFFGQANRKKSKEDGMIIPLCFSHHNGSNAGIHFNHNLDIKIKQLAEKVWINTYTEADMSYESKIDKFIERYGKNYLDDSCE